jgi:hypothetical protein
MSENQALFQRSEATANEKVDKFLEGLNAGSSRSGRLIFALDATASRKATWDTASQLQGEMFREAAAIGGLSLQLVYFRGFGECQASPWVSQPERLLRLMEKVDCLAGITQISRVLSHAQREVAKESVAALVFIGDACEENPDTLIVKARELGRLKTPCFMFQEGRDSEVEAAFRGIARNTGGAYGQFGPSSAKQLSELLQAVGAFAGGGVTALEKRGDAASRLLLGQLKQEGTTR